MGREGSTSEREAALFPNFPVFILEFFLFFTPFYPFPTLVQALFNRNIAAVQKAIEEGARINDRGFNALDCIVGTLEKVASSDTLVEICVFLMTNYPALITENNAKIVFKSENDQMATVLIGAVKIQNTELAYKLFHMAMSTVKPARSTQSVVPIPTVNPINQIGLRRNWGHEIPLREWRGQEVLRMPPDLQLQERLRLQAQVRVSLIMFDGEYKIKFIIVTIGYSK